MVVEDAECQNEHREPSQEEACDVMGGLLAEDKQRTCTVGRLGQILLPPSLMAQSAPSSF